MNTLEYIVWLPFAWLTIILIELLFSIYWIPFYFSKGLPIFVRKIKVPQANPYHPCALRIEREFQETFFLPELEFHKIGPNQYGFREPYFLFRKRMGSVMHGYLKYDHQNSLVIVKGYANLTFLFIVLILLGLFILGFVPSLFLFWGVALFLIGLVPYLIEIALFGKVAAKAAWLWSADQQKEEKGTGPDA